MMIATLVQMPLGYIRDLVRGSLGAQSTQRDPGGGPGPMDMGGLQGNYDDGDTGEYIGAAGKGLRECCAGREFLPRFVREAVTKGGGTAKRPPRFSRRKPAARLSQSACGRRCCPPAPTPPPVTLHLSRSAFPRLPSPVPRLLSFLPPPFPPFLPPPVSPLRPLGCCVLPGYPTPVARLPQSRGPHRHTARVPAGRLWAQMRHALAMARSCRPKRTG